MAILLGCIADDITGATDIAAMLKRGGMRGSTSSSSRRVLSNRAV